jgi:hypothetical protein
VILLHTWITGFHVSADLFTMIVYDILVRDFCHFRCTLCLCDTIDMDTAEVFKFTAGRVRVRRVCPVDTVFIAYCSVNMFPVHHSSHTNIHMLKNKTTMCVYI